MKKNNLQLLSRVVLLLSVALFFSSCKDTTDPVATKFVADYDAKILIEWQKTFLDVERYAAGFRPGPAPRSLAYIGLAAYEACIDKMPNYNSITGRYSGLEVPKVAENLEYHYPTVLNALYANLMSKFFSHSDAEQLQKIEDTKAYFDNQFSTENPDVIQRSVAHGNAVAEAAWAWSKTDAVGHDANLDPFGTYNWQDHYDAPGDWVPTAPGPGKPMFPNWGSARRFAISTTDRVCDAPIPYSEDVNSQLYVQAAEVYARSKVQTFEDKWIGEYWSDDLVNLTFSPGPRWAAIAIQVYENNQSNLETVLYCNAKLGMALNDAAVACWFSKYYYNVERPVTYINRLIDPEYKPALFNPLTNTGGLTPSFPAFPSGHSTMGGAAAEVLTDVFGLGYELADRCHENRTEFLGDPRFFHSFYEMAEENAISRVPLGVHFRMDCEVGVDLGYLCGRRVNQLNWKK